MYFGLPIYQFLSLDFHKTSQNCKKFSGYVAYISNEISMKFVRITKIIEEKYLVIEISHCYVFWFTYLPTFIVRFP